MKQNKKQKVKGDQGKQVGQAFPNVRGSTLQGSAVNLRGICSFTEARLSEILPVKHQRQALILLPTFPLSLQLAFQPWKKEKSQETDLMLWKAAKVRSKRNSWGSLQKLEWKSVHLLQGSCPMVSKWRNECAGRYIALKKLKVCRSVLWPGLSKSVCY